MKFSCVVLLLAALSVFVGCSKSEAVLSEVKSKDLGVVNLTYGSPSKQDIGNGMVCVLTANSMGARSCELIIRIEKSGKVIDSRRIIPAELDKPAELIFENAQVTFTPHIVQ